MKHLGTQKPILTKASTTTLPTNATTQQQQLVDRALESKTQALAQAGFRPTVFAKRVHCFASKWFCFLNFATKSRIRAPSCCEGVATCEAALLVSSHLQRVDQQRSQAAPAASSWFGTPTQKSKKVPD